MKSIKILLAAFLLFSNCFSVIEIRNRTRRLIKVTYEVNGQCKSKELNNNESHEFAFKGRDNHLIIRANAIKTASFGSIEDENEYTIKIDKGSNQFQVTMSERYFLY